MGKKEILRICDIVNRLYPNKPRRLLRGYIAKKINEFKAFAKDHVSSGFGAIADEATYEYKETDISQSIKFLIITNGVIQAKLEKERAKKPQNDAIIAELRKELTDNRNIFGSLIDRQDDRGEQTIASLDGNIKSAKYQLAMTEFADKQYDSIEGHNTALNTEIDNNQRMIEIANYEHERNSSHKNILKIIAYCSFFILVGIGMHGLGNTYIGWLGIPLIVISIILAVILTATRTWWNYQRDARDWGKFDWPAPQ